jgi:hypothetical protein
VEELGGGAAGEQGQDADDPPGLLDGPAFVPGNLSASQVAAFDVEVRLCGVEEAGGSQVVEDADGIDAFEGGEDEGAVVLGIERAGWAFESANGGIAVESDDEEVGLGAGAGEISDVAGVEDVKAAVGCDDGESRPASAGSPGGHLGELEEFALEPVPRGIRHGRLLRGLFGHRR